MRSRDDTAAIGLALLRITLGVIIVRTWFVNLDEDLYTADGLEGFFDWLFSPEGNDSSLGFYESLLDAVIVPVSGLYGAVQLVVELLMGLGLIAGALTRLWSALAALFFANLFLAYFGGHEWIWTYVLLLMSAVAVFLGAAGRRWGVDELLEQRHPTSRFAVLW